MASAAKGSIICYLSRQLLESEVLNAGCSSCRLLRMRQEQPPMQERHALPHVGSLVSPKIALHGTPDWMAGSAWVTPLCASCAEMVPDATGTSSPYISDGAPFKKCMPGPTVRPTRSLCTSCPAAARSICLENRTGLAERGRARWSRASYCPGCRCSAAGWGRASARAASLVMLCRT